jgi:hypothetical protein
MLGGTGIEPGIPGIRKHSLAIGSGHLQIKLAESSLCQICATSGCARKRLLTIELRFGTGQAP